MWKLDGTKLINQKGEWKSNVEWKFVPEGELCFIQNIERSKVLSLVSDKEEETSVTEMFMEPKGLKQLWQIGTPNEDGFFTITEPLSKKVLHASGTSKLKIDGTLFTPNVKMKNHQIIPHVF